VQAGVLLDRDGVINRNRAEHIKSWAEFEFLPGALEALRMLADLGIPVAILTNQSVIGRGLASEEAVAEINARMMAAIRAAGGRVDGVWVCPHTPEDNCLCRKPRPGLLLQASAVLALDLSRSYFIGDARSDVEAALAVGCQPVFVCTGRGESQLRLLHAAGLDDVPVKRNLQHAVRWVYDAVQAAHVNAA
jgi:D-glycero-D-manno-heptose 1,7-bisphosphate phosphatase